MDTVPVEQETLGSSIALNHISLQLLKDRAKDCKRLWIALIVSILVNLVTVLTIVGCFLWYESQWEYSTETVTVEQDTGEGTGNNVY